MWIHFAFEAAWSNLPTYEYKPVDVNTKLAKITFNKGETYDSFYERFLDIEKEVELSLHKVSNTAVIETFMALLTDVECVVPRLSTIFVDLNTHIEEKGPNVDFRFSLEAIYRYLKSSGIDTKVKFLSHKLYYLLVLKHLLLLSLLMQQN